VQTTYILESLSDRDRMFLLFDLWRDEFHRMLDGALALAKLPADPDTASWRMLDVGCGEGLVSVDILERFPKVSIVAFDRDPEAVATGRLSYADYPNLRMYQRDAHAEIPAEFEPGIAGRESFDLVLMRLVLTHFTDGATVLRNVAAALKPGGIVLMLDPRTDCYGHFPHPSFAVLQDALCTAWRYFGTYDAGRRHGPLAEQAGLQIVESVDYQIPVGGTDPIDRSNLKLAIETLVAARRGLVELGKVISAADFDEHIRRLRYECPPELVGYCPFQKTIARKP